MTYSRLFYHIIWTTKERLPLITPQNADVIYNQIRVKTHDFKGIVHASNGMPDHVHLVVTLPPTLTIAEYVRQIKGATSFLASRLTSSVEPFAWQEQYGVLTVSESHLPTLKDYVDRQQEHHTRRTVDPRLEKASET